MTHVHVLDWILHLVVNRCVRSVMIEPPCTTFSIMRKPPLRSTYYPFGFEMIPRHSLEPCWDIGHSKFCRLVLGVLENPWASLIKNLPPWEDILSHPECELVKCDLCPSGSPHLKAFAFLCVWAETSYISLRCCGDHVHVPVRGGFDQEVGHLRKWPSRCSCQGDGSKYR